jgi:NADPH:quinone reductase-like Zn-dependent oxidoreductase
MLCVRGGLLGTITNGGFAEEVSVPVMNLEKISEGVSWELAASLPVAALTPFHALKRANLNEGEKLVVFGASGNTGMFGVQFGDQIGANVYAVSSKKWVTNLGAKEVFGYKEAVKRLEEATDRSKADVVLNSIGEKTWENSLNT